MLLLIVAGRWPGQEWGMAERLRGDQWVNHNHNKSKFEMTLHHRKVSQANYFNNKDFNGLPIDHFNQALKQIQARAI